MHTKYIDGKNGILKNRMIIQILKINGKAIPSIR